MPTAADLIALARQEAAEHQLYPELVCAICEQESAWNPWAVRFEPNFYDLYVAPLARAGKLAGETEARLRACSWGLMQVMGQTERGHGFYGRFLVELCDPGVGLEIGCRILAARLAAAEGNVTRALLLWNGGGNPDYPAQVLARVLRQLLVELGIFAERFDDRAHHARNLAARNRNRLDPFDLGDNHFASIAIFDTQRFKPAAGLRLNQHAHRAIG